MITDVSGWSRDILEERFGILEDAIAFKAINAQRNPEGIGMLQDDVEVLTNMILDEEHPFDLDRAKRVARHMVQNMPNYSDLEEKHEQYRTTLRRIANGEQAYDPNTNTLK